MGAGGRGDGEKYLACFCSPGLVRRNSEALNQQLIEWFCYKSGKNNCSLHHPSWRLWVQFWFPETMFCGDLVLPVAVWLLSKFSRFLPQFGNKHVSFRTFELSLGVYVIQDSCWHYWPCDELAVTDPCSPEIREEVGIENRWIDGNQICLIFMRIKINQLREKFFKNPYPRQYKEDHDIARYGAAGTSP